MAESPVSSTSDKPPIEKQGLGLLISDTPPSDPITSDQDIKFQPSCSSQNASDEGNASPTDGAADGVLKEIGTTFQEEELGSSIERELLHLTVVQAEIEAVHEKLEAINVAEAGSDVEVVKEDIDEEKDEKGSEPVDNENESEEERNDMRMTESDHIDEEKDDEDAKSVEEENQNEEGDDEDDGNVDGQSGQAVTNLGRHNNSNNRRRTNYPMRPDAEDCAYYMKFGSCKFGLNCKFNHPPRRKNQGIAYAVLILLGVKEKAINREENFEKTGQTECKVYDCRHAVIVRSFSFALHTSLSVYIAFSDISMCLSLISVFLHLFSLPICAFELNHCTVCCLSDAAVYLSFLQYYLTSGGCRYGKDCNYSHGSDKSSTSHIPEYNFLGLPIRPGEKECPYYMRTGSCKYGANCRFHHPDPKTVAGGGSGYGNDRSLPSQVVSSSPLSSWSASGAFTSTTPFVPVIYPPTQGAARPNPEWNGYQRKAYPTSERSLPTPPAFAINNLPTEINFPLQHQHDMAVQEHPERPGEPECSFFLKTGDCKFKSNCKFHHPKNRNPKPKANSFALNDKGLPLRPDQPICTHYHRYGICKFGPAYGAETSGHGNETEPSV
ncbi:UNVERIFIED_CONTAM: Zinc finger CCCH domain-containing protein 67 [Sesamum calycinum]|uniref:Zinc finger CCCH domain-containing protein 67 n=1 Tax=Sesamum calycinum TaxID=2727403 RepID=A0AAW2NFY6_9LAMI